jgi:hypothetical protein
MNTMQKMRRVNVIIRKRLTELGFYDIRMFGHSRWFKDVYGWDGVAKFPYNKKNYWVVWIQVKSGYISEEDKIELRQFCIDSDQRGLFAEYVDKKVDYVNKKGTYSKKVVKLTPIRFALGGGNDRRPHT